MIRNQIDRLLERQSHFHDSSRIDRPSVLFIGDASHVDFGSVVAILSAAARVCQVSADALAPDISTLPPVEPPQLVLLAQSYPGEVDPALAIPLRQRYPLAPAILLLGSWCEGYGRTGGPHAGLMRLYWHEFPHWWERQTSLLSQGRCPDWAQPAPDRSGTVTVPMETTMQDRGGRPLVVLHTARWDTADALSAVLSRAGFATVWQRPGRPRLVIHGAAAAIWEGGQLEEGEALELEELCHQLGSGTPVIGLVDFPRAEHLERLSQLGVSSLLGKPWIASELVSTLHALLNPQFAKEDAAAA